MATKPTYEELEQGAQRLERESLERKRAEEALKEGENKYRELADLLPQTVFELDERGNFTFANRHGFQSSGYTQEDIDKGLNALGLFIPEDRERLVHNIRKILSGKRSQGHEYTVLRKDGSTFPVLIYSSPIMRDSKPVGLRGVAVDMTERKQAEEALQRAHDELELRVRERTEELVKANELMMQEIRERRKAEEELEIKGRNLQEINTALRVLLKRRDEDKIELEEKVLSNMKALVRPYLEKLKKTGMDERQKAYVDILESYLDNIISPFSRTLSSKLLHLTPTEIQVAGLVRDGKTAKEIAQLLNKSTRAIESHRINIRRKLGLTNSKSNLSSYLLSLA
jgi:PAS domain S-box-containing protein